MGLRDAAAVESATAPARAARPASHALRRALPLAAWVGLILAAWAWGTELNRSGSEMGLGAPPMFGSWDLRVGLAIALPVAFAGLTVAFAPALARALSWRWLLAAAGGGALCWSLTLALSAGLGGLFDPLARPTEYLAGVEFVGSPGEYLAGFTDQISTYPTHVKSHPPGLVIGLWGLDQVGLGGAKPASIAIVVIAASAVPATLIAARAVAGERWARRAAPFLVLAPAAVWIATSGDALYMGVGAWAVTATVLAIESRGRRSTRLALAGGGLFALCAFLSYGLALLGLVPTALAVARRHFRPILIVARVVGATILVVYVGTGFLWLEGLLATREEYFAGIAPNRPYEYFLVANLAAFALATGPALAVALTRVRVNRVSISAVWALPLGALAAILLADLSGMSKAEVERIWLPFVPWALLATGTLVPSASTRVLLGATGALAIAIQVGVRLLW